MNVPALPHKKKYYIRFVHTLHTDVFWIPSEFVAARDTKRVGSRNLRQLQLRLDLPTWHRLLAAKPGPAGQQSWAQQGTHRWSRACVEGAAPTLQPGELGSC